jgi:hypothetical protein
MRRRALRKTIISKAIMRLQGEFSERKARGKRARARSALQNSDGRHTAVTLKNYSDNMH